MPNSQSSGTDEDHYLMWSEAYDRRFQVRFQILNTSLRYDTEVLQSQKIRPNFEIFGSCVKNRGEVSEVSNKSEVNSIIVAQYISDKFLRFKATMR